MAMKGVARQRFVPFTRAFPTPERPYGITDRALIEKIIERDAGKPLQRDAPIPEMLGLIPNLGNKDPFHGGALVLPVRRAARRDAPASGKPRNAAGGPMRPTEGRQLLSAGVVALLIRCGGIELRSAP
ncbi:MAG: hypothetical protein V3R75_04790, partial [Alphaproteobacteria bacterium]